MNHTLDTLPPIREDLFTGIDVGGTKVHIADTLSTTVHRYDTPSYPDMDAVLDDYFQKMGARAARIAIGMAGPRDDETGEIKLTNSDWSVFNPNQASKKYRIEISTVNDMVAATAGVLAETGIDMLPLKAGTPTNTGTKMVVTLSTGIGAAAAVWDPRSRRYVILAGEGGHIGFQPKNAEEQAYLAYLHTKYPHASAELALSGKHGFENLITHTLAHAETNELVPALERARSNDQPIGAVLLEFATAGNGKDREISQKILGRMGAMIGSVLRDLTVAYKATGGVYLIGSVSLALGEYFAERTEMNERFVRRGAVHDGWLENVPISLITDPNVAAIGALALAKD